MQGKPTLLPIDGGYAVMVGKSKVGTILSDQESTGRYSFRIDGDPCRRLYRGKEVAMEAVLLHRRLAQGAKSKKEAIFLAWSQKPSTSHQ